MLQQQVGRVKETIKNNAISPVGLRNQARTSWDYTAKEQASTYNTRCYTTPCMKLLFRPTLIIIIISLLIFLTISLSGFGYVQTINTDTQAYTSGALIAIQTTATPQAEEDRSEIGSTDWITVMSIVIVAIVIVPILLKRKSWSQD